MNKIKAFFREYTDELFYKVQWPNLPDLQSSTITVLIASLIIAVCVLTMDAAFKQIMSLLYSVF